MFDVAFLILLSVYIYMKVCGLMKTTPPPAFSDMTITDSHPDITFHLLDITFHLLKAHGCGLVS